MIFNKLNITRKDIFIFVSAVWGLLFLFGFIAIFVVDSKKTGILNSFGGYMNISTSMIGLATIYLISQAIKYQKKELKAMKKEMKKQRQSAENEEKLNRTVKYIDEWIACYETSLTKQLTNDQNQYLLRLKYIFLSKAKSKIDFKLLVEIISKHGLLEIIEHEKVIFKTQKDKYEADLNEGNFSDLDLYDAQNTLHSILDDAIKDQETTTYIDSILNESPEGYLKSTLRGEISHLNMKLDKLASHEKFINDMSKESEIND